LYELECKVDPKTRTKPEASLSAEVTTVSKTGQKENPDGKAGKVKHWKPATIRQAVIVTRCFIHWCYEEKLISQDLAEALQIPKNKRRMQRTLNDDEIQALLDACDLKTVKGIRDAALVSLLTDLGLRSIEVRRLTKNDLYFNVKLGEEVVNVMIVTGKGDNQDPAFFGQATADRLRDWLKVRPEKEGVAELFISLGGNTPGQPFTRYGLRNTLSKLGKKVGIEGVTTHAFRRSFACIADDAGASTRKIQLWGRWSDIRMVERYTLALKAGKQYNQYSPIDYLEAKRQNGKDSTEQEG
jgi:integrase/recombinase XerD